MSIASAFNEIAVAQGGAASKTGSIAGAIDALNDALAGSDQQGAETIEDAVRLLGNHIGGGGGGVTFGNLAGGVWTTETVSVGASASSATFLETTQVKIGDTVVVDSAGQAIQFVAGGADAVAIYNSDTQLTFAKAYDVTIDMDTGKYATVEEIDMSVASTTVEIEGETGPAWEYTVPSLAEGHYYVLRFATGE